MSQGYRARKREEAERALSRRKFLTMGGIAAGATLATMIGIPVWRHLHPAPTYEEAYANPKLRQAWLDSIERPLYVSAMVYDPARLHAISKSQIERAGADTEPNDKSRLLRGSTSTISVSDVMFYNPADHGEIICRTALTKHEFVHAAHHYGGIPDVPLEHLLVLGEVNEKVYEPLSEVIADHTEFAAYQKIPTRDIHERVVIDESSSWLDVRQVHIASSAQRAYERLQKVTRDPVILAVAEQNSLRIRRVE